MVKERKKLGGFTLIELMVAMAIMAFGVLGFMFLQTRSVAGRTFSRELNRAVIIAQQQMDRLLAADYNDPMLAAGNHPTAAEDTTDGVVDGQMTVNLQNFIYHITWTVRDNLPTTGFKGIAVRYSAFLKNHDRPHDPKDIANYPRSMRLLSIKRR